MPSLPTNLFLPCISRHLVSLPAPQGPFAPLRCAVLGATYPLHTSFLAVALSNNVMERIHTGGQPEPTQPPPHGAAKRPGDDSPLGWFQLWGHCNPSFPRPPSQSLPGAKERACERGRKPTESPAGSRHRAESRPRQECLAQGGKKTPSSVPLQTGGRTSSNAEVMAKQQPRDGWAAACLFIGLQGFPLLCLFAFWVKNCARHS